MHGQFQFTIPRRLLCGIVLIAGLAVDSPDAWGQPPRIERVPGNSAPPPARPEAGAPAVRPAPAAASPFGADQVRLPLLPFGGTPKPTRETLKQFDEYVEEIRDTENTLDLVQNRPRLMRLRQTRRAKFLYLDDTMIGEEVGTLELPSADMTPEQKLGKQEVAQVLQKEIGRIPPLLRNVFMLRDVQQLPMPDVAERLGISVAAAKSRLLRARMELRERLSKHEGRLGAATLTV